MDAWSPYCECGELRVLVVTDERSDSSFSCRWRSHEVNEGCPQLPVAGTRCSRGVPVPTASYYCTVRLRNPNGPRPAGRRRRKGGVSNAIQSHPSFAFQNSRHFPSAVSVPVSLFSLSLEALNHDTVSDSKQMFFTELLYKLLQSVGAIPYGVLCYVK
jgi:hypothetical protein